MSSTWTVEEDKAVVAEVILAEVILAGEIGVESALDATANR